VVVVVVVFSVGLSVGLESEASSNVCMYVCMYAWMCSNIDMYVFEHVCILTRMFAYLPLMHTENSVCLHHYSNTCIHASQL